MADKRISELDNAASLVGSELVPIVQPVTDPKKTVHVTIDDILALSVISLNTRKGDVSLLSADVTSALGFIPQSAITLTTIGSSGAATFIDNVLNIPQYSGGGLSFYQTINNLTIPGGPVAVTQRDTTTYIGGLVAFDDSIDATTNIGLGDFLTDISMTGPSNSFILRAATLQLYGLSNDLFFQGQGTGSLTTSLSLGRSSVVTLQSKFNGSVYSNISFDANGGFLFTDNYAGYGIGYNADYSVAGISHYGNRWVTDKGYVDAHLFGYTFTNSPSTNFVPQYNGTNITWVAGGGGGSSPFADNTAILKNNSDNTKLLKFDLSGFTTSTTNTLTPPNYSGTIATLAGTETFTNKNITPRTNSTTSTSSITPDATAFDLYDITALATGLTIVNPSTSGNGYSFVLRIKDNATPQTLTWGTQYRGVGGSLPSTTVASQVMYISIIYNLADSKWDVPVSSSVANGTTNQIAYFDSPTTVASLTTATYPSLTELSYLKGVTAPIVVGWGITGTTNLSGVVAINSTTPSGKIFGSTWIAIANNDFITNRTGTITARSTTSDVLNGEVFSYTMTSGGSTQTANAILINPTFAGGFTSNNILKLQTGSSDRYVFGTTSATFSNNANFAFTLNVNNTTSGTASKTIISLLSSSMSGSLSATSAGFTTSGINVASSLILQSNSGNLIIGTNNGNELSFWTTAIKRSAIDQFGNFFLTQGAQNFSATQNSALILTPGAHTAIAANTEVNDYIFASANHTWTDGTISKQAWAWFKAPSLLGTTTLATATNGITVQVDAPIASTKGAITNPWAIWNNGNLKVSGSIGFFGTNSTGAGSALLGTNSPAITNTAPYTWLTAIAADGSTVYIPCWK